ncbi:putative Alpha-SNAP [Giardia muris]|uniref:Putative Alpha-SNAP n=1 Tax=Giardia muris TaxID=5742 RepID=A0A4Z1SMW4_GIAMU|nr:putative Alpha-SNAP [Giardia muris]|eukprot:TNJ26920.1 putative Alpha-SNAP [Giardia muris]
MAATYADQAAAYVRIAEDKLKKRFMKRPDTDAAVEYYEKAGGYFKMDKKYLRAGECFERCAQLLVESGKPQLAVSHYQNAIAAYNQDNPELASAVTDKLLDACLKAGRFLQAGKITRELAEKYEDDGRLDEAYTCYKKAEDILRAEPSADSERRNCRIRIAEIGALQYKLYESSAAEFEKIAAECARVKLLQFHARGFLLSAYLCLCIQMDHVALENAFERYQNLDPNLDGSPELDFMMAMPDIIKEQAYERFVEENTKLTNRLGALLKANEFKRTLLNLIGDKLQDNAAAAECEGEADELL